jgi:hypothetical protein
VGRRSGSNAERENIRGPGLGMGIGFDLVGCEFSDGVLGTGESC